MTVESAMIVGREFRFRIQFPGQHSGSEGHARQNSYLSSPRLSKKKFRRPLPKNIEDDLDRLHSVVLDRFQCFFDFLHTHAVVTKLALLDEIVQFAEQLRMVINLTRRTMQLQQVECVSFQITQAAINKIAQVLPG